MNIPKHLSKLLYFAFCLILLAPATAQALSEAQRRAFDSDVFYFNIEPTPDACQAGATALIGSDNAEQIWNFFMGKGLQPPQVAGIMGNFQAESGLNPRRVQNTQTPEGDSDTPTSGVGFGLAQWTFSGRQQPLVDLANSKGLPAGDLGVQLDYVMQEFEGGYRSTYDDLLTLSDVDAATDLIMVRYEGPRDQSESAKEHRREFSRALLAQYGSSGNAPTASGGTVCGTSAHGQVVGGFSLPLDRRWYDEHQIWFTKPHHDYPASDIPVPVGTPVYSMTAGRITSAPNGTATEGCGLGITVDAGNGVTFSYCHGSDGGSVPGARVGDTVVAGQLLMHSENTGNSTGPHLHVGIKISGQSRCPQSLFTGIADGSPPDLMSLPTSGCTN